MGTHGVLRFTHPGRFAIAAFGLFLLFAPGYRAFAEGGEGGGLSIIEREIHSFTLKAEKSESVSLVGDFNGWNERSHRMQRLTDGTWQVDVALRKGKVYEYAFLVDGKLVLDPANKISTSDGKLSVINVGEKAEIFIGDPTARMEAMQLSLNRLVEQIAFLSKQVEAVAGGLKDEHDLVLKKEAQVDMMRTELDTARMERVASSRDLIQKDAKLMEVTEKFNALRLDHQEKTALLDSQTQRVTTMQKSIDEFQTKFNNGLQETRDLREKSQTAASRASTAEQELGQLRTKCASLERDLRDKSTSLKILTGKTGGGGTDESTGSEVPGAGASSGTARGIHGSVLAVSEKINLLFVSVGLENGLSDGQSLYVYRGDALIAQVTVKKADKDQAEAFANDGFDWKRIHNGDTIVDVPRGPVEPPGPDDGSGDKGSVVPEKTPGANTDPEKTPEENPPTKTGEGRRHGG